MRFYFSKAVKFLFSFNREMSLTHGQYIDIKYLIHRPPSYHSNHKYVHKKDILDQEEERSNWKFYIWLYLSSIRTIETETVFRYLSTTVCRGVV